MKYRTGAQIRAAREAKDLKQSEVAKLVGVASSTFANWEQGTNRPNADQLAVLCRVLDVSADSLLELGTPVVSKADEELVAAYHAAPLDVQRAVALLLGRYKKGATDEAK